MADPKENQDDIAIIESQDGSATVDLPDGMIDDDAGESKNDFQSAQNGDQGVADEDADHPDDDADLRAAKRNRRKAIGVLPVVEPCARMVGLLRLHDLVQAGLARG